MQGPSKYDKECAAIRIATEARSALLIVLGGKRGNGFSAQTHPADAMVIPELLRIMADEIEKSGPLAYAVQTGGPKNVREA